MLLILELQLLIVQPIHLTIAGGTNITTTITGDTVTVDFSGTLVSTFAALTDTDVTGITQGDSLYWNGTNWVSNQVVVLSFGGNLTLMEQMLAITHLTDLDLLVRTNDPTLYVMRGLTYAFDNTVQWWCTPI